MNTRTSEMQDMAVESVDEDGTVVFRLGSGLTMSFTISEEMVPYYRRLAEAAHAPPASVSH